MLNEKLHTSGVKDRGTASQNSPDDLFGLNNSISVGRSNKGGPYAA